MATESFLFRRCGARRLNETRGTRELQIAEGSLHKRFCKTIYSGPARFRNSLSQEMLKWKISGKIGNAMPWIDQVQTEFWAN